MADIRKRKGKKPYQVRFLDRSTKSGYGYKSFIKWGDADAFRKEKDVEENGGIQPTDLKSIPEAIDRWLEIARTEGRRNPGEPASPATMEQYEYRARIMRRYPWTVGIHDLHERHGIEFRSWLLQNYTADTSHKVLSSFHSVILAMKDRHVINRDPLEKVTISNRSRHREPIKIPSVEEFLSILRAADNLANSKNQQIARTWQRYRPMIYLAADSGMRPQELLALPPQSVLQTGLNLIQALDRSGKVGPPKTKAGRRFIPVGPEALEMALHYADSHGNSRFVFPQQKGGECQQYRISYVTVGTA